MIRYTATHSTGATKTRTSRGHTAPVYTNALWVRWTGEPSHLLRRSGQWECASMGQRATIETEANRLRKAGGYDLEIVPLTTST